MFSTYKFAKPFSTRILKLFLELTKDREKEVKEICEKYPPYSLYFCTRSNTEF